MTINAVRRKLRSIRHIYREIETLTEQIAETRTRAEGAGGFSEEFHANNGLVQSKVENCVIQILGYEQKLLNKRLALQGAVEVAEELINLLKGEKEIAMRATLRNIYILCKTQEQTAVDLDYSYRQIQYLEWRGVKLIAQRESAQRRLAKRK